jgi:O-antigen ligase
MVKARHGVKVLSSAERAREDQQFVEPNPGDLMMILVFGWSLLCFFIVTIGKSLLFTIAQLVSSTAYRRLLMESGEAFAVLMIVISVLLVLTVVLATKFPKTFLAAWLFSMTFASAQWKPIHDVSFIYKYLGVLYFSVYGAVFIYKNFLRLISIPNIRILVIYVGWIGGVCLLVGGRTADIWYFSTEISIFIGFAICWLYFFNKRYGLEQFWMTVAWGCVATIIMHSMAPLVVDSYYQQGRYVSLYLRATAFALALSPVVITMFWAGMAGKTPFFRGFFTFMGILGLFLIVISGSRGPTATTLVGIGILWWLFRTKSVLVMLYLAILAAAAQVVFSIGSGAVDFSVIGDRLDSVDDSHRFELWLRYLDIALDSPIYGYSPSKFTFAIIGSRLEAVYAALGLKASSTGIHNSYLGMLMRVGGVALVLYLSLIIMAFSRARQVLLSKVIPFAEKRLYILPAAMIPVISVMCFVEDRIPGSGKGTTEQVFLYVSLIICQVYGTRLLNEYQHAGNEANQLRTVEGYEIATQQTDMPG